MPTVGESTELSKPAVGGKTVSVSTTQSARSKGPPGPGPDTVGVGNIEHLYIIYDRLNSADNKATLERDFRELLSAVKGTDKEKRLASQFITRFMEFFPLLYGEAIDALLDLCEDDDVSIRKQVEKDMIGVCKKIISFVPKVADVYAQLMQTNDGTELSSLQNCLISLFHIDAKATIVGIFSQIGSGEDIVRTRCLKFLSVQLKELSPELTNDVFESTLLASVQKVIGDMTSDDFKTLIQILMDTKLLKTISGQQAIVDMIAEQLDFNKDLDVSYPDNVDRLLICCKQVQPLFSTQVSSTPFLIYFCKKVVPKLRDASLLEEGTEVAIDVLKTMADFASHLSHIDSAQALECMEVVYSELLEILPLPPDDDEEHTVKYDFNFVECYLFVLHKLGQHVPEFLGDVEKLKDLRQRLQYFARSSQAYMKKLKEDFTLAQSQAETDFKGEENRVKIIAYKMISNINLIIKDLFHTPPTYKSVIRLSWRPFQKTNVAPPGSLKRKPNQIQMRGGPPGKVSRGNDRERVLYQPPSGKFSKRSGTYSASPPSSRGRGGGGGGFRGGARGFRGGANRNARRPFRGRH